MVDSAKKMNRRQTAARPRGMMLVEVSVAVALSTIVLGLIVSVAVALKQMDRRMHKRSVERQRQLELAELIRTDIRLAAEVVLASDESFVVHLADEQERRYEIAGGGIHRRLFMPDGKASGADFFEISAADAWTIEREESGRRPLVMVTLRRQFAEEPHISRPIPFIAYAALGADVPPARDEAISNSLQQE